MEKAMYSIENLLERLAGLADERYRLFNESLTPGAENRSIGVRMPALRKIAGEILSGDAGGFLDASVNSDIHEINLLHAIVLCRADEADEVFLSRLRAFVPTIGNWAVCDLLCNDLKPTPGRLSVLLPLLDEYARSPNEFEVRFALVMRMLYCRDDAHIDETFRVYESFRHGGYYAQMGAAWGLSYLFVDHRERTLAFLKNSPWDRFTHNKAIQKIIESHRVCAEDKALLRSLRK